MKNWYTFLRTEVFPQERYGLTKTEQAILLSKFPSQETVRTNKQVAKQAIEDDELPPNPETVRKHMWTIYNERFCPKDGKEGFPGYKQRSQNKDQQFLAWLKQQYLQWLQTSNFDTPLESASEANHLIQVSRAALGKLSNHVPDLPLNFLPRFDALKDVKKLVLDGTNQPVGVTGTALRVGVQGMGGIGKSVLAAMLARDEEVRHSFPDGILWVTLGQNPALTLRQLDLAKMLGDSSQMFQDVQQGRVHLSELLADKACLLILDDVWQSKHAEAFNALGQKCKMLITTRDNKVLQELGTVGYLLGLLEDEEALTLLALWAKQEKETLPLEAHEVVGECGNLPLALAMIGALVQGKPDRWGNLLHKLCNANLEKIRHQFPDYPYPNLLKAIQVSIEALEIDIQKRYLDFAVFPEDTPIPEAMLQTFWELEGLDEFNTQDVVDVLVERSLAQRDDKGCLTLHDLQYDYVRKQAGDLPALHNRFVNSYSSRCSNGWHTGPNDGYFFENLAYHLHESGRKQELYELLTKSPDWMEAKYIACTGDAAYVADLELAISDFADPLEANQLLTLTQLQTARQVVNQRVTNYSDTDLATLVWLGRETEAVGYARLREFPESRFKGLLAVFKAEQKKGEGNYLLLKELKELALSIQMKSWDKASILVNLAVAISQTEYFVEEFSIVIEEAKKFVNIRSSFQAYLLTKLAEALDKRGQKEKASTAFAQARQIALDEQHTWHQAFRLRDLVATLAQLRRFCEAKQIANDIEVECLKVQALSELAKALIHEGLGQEVDAIFTEIKVLIEANNSHLTDHYEESIDTLGEFAAVLAQAGHEEDTDQFFTKAKRFADESPWWYRDESQSRLIYHLAQARRFDEAYKVACTIHKGSWTRAKALSILANTLAHVGQSQEAIKIFTEAREAASITKDRQTSAAMGNLAVVMEKAGYKAQAEAIFTKIRKTASNSDEYEQLKIWTILAIAFAQVGRFSEVQEVLQMIPPTNPFRVKALSALAVALEQNGQTLEADRVFQNIQEFAHKPMTISSIDAPPQSTLVKALAQVGRFNQAMENMLYIEDDLEKVQALCAVAATLTNAKLEIEANRIFMEAKAATYAVESYGRRESAVWTFAAALSQAGHFDLAKKEVQLLIDNDLHRREGLSGLAAPIANIGHFVEAFATLGLQTLDKFLYDLSEWASAFEKVQPSLSLEVMREAVCIAGWVRPHWKEISQLFPEITNS
ncbi:tetratricopeptide repeat protein [Nostoc sp. LEGE 12447]|uniref:NB-ARC domain-containing protein n=1 Tax=Nostoc sp. LEGE 12447 TaxID=1828640 RepID=UPI001883AEB8|nr:NB-ARC domain-containing protein [Nostoc sp. LEGE 12447]MBE9001168.1 tetratricopeptide repeat protein [Nostoc sp. LEGE 12447]